MDDNLSELKELLDTTRDFEHLSFLKGVAGLYYRAAISMALGLIIILILDGISEGEIYYDKGFPHTQFTLPEIGFFVFFIAFFGDLSFQMTRFLTDQQYTDYLSRGDRKNTIVKIIFSLVLLGVLYGLIIIIFINIMEEWFAWALFLVFIGGFFTYLAKITNHLPSYIVGGMSIIAGVLLKFAPPPVWTVVMMVLMSSFFITGIVSYIKAN